MHRLADDACPACERKLNAVESTNENPEPPEPGDITLCIGCTAVLSFDDEMKLKELSQDEFNALDQETQNEMLRAITMLRYHKGPARN